MSEYNSRMVIMMKHFKFEGTSVCFQYIYIHMYIYIYIEDLLVK